MLILGIDPGIERLGYGFVESRQSELRAVSYGLITTDKKLKKGARLLQIYEDVKKLIEERPPDHVAIESIIFAKNVKTALIISEVRGILLLIAELCQKPVIEFTPPQVKKSVTGYGKADKLQIQSAVKLILSLETAPKPDDIADALAIAICGANYAHFQQKLKGV